MLKIVYKRNVPSFFFKDAYKYIGFLKFKGGCNLLLKNKNYQH